MNKGKMLFISAILCWVIAFFILLGIMYVNNMKEQYITDVNKFTVLVEKGTENAEEVADINLEYWDKYIYTDFYVSVNDALNQANLDNIDKFNSCSKDLENIEIKYKELNNFLNKSNQEDLYNSKIKKYITDLYMKYEELNRLALYPENNYFEYKENYVRVLNDLQKIQDDIEDTLYSMERR